MTIDLGVALTRHPREAGRKGFNGGEGQARLLGLVMSAFEADEGTRREDE